MPVAPTVIYDDVELWATGYLRTALAARPETYGDEPVFVSNEMPKNAATGEEEQKLPMVIVRRDGGGRLPPVFDQPRLAVDCWAEKKQDAIDLCRMVCALLESAPGDANVKKAEMTSGPTRISDPSRTPRVYATLDVKTKGTVL